MSGKKILLIDGHGIAFRAFYAIPELNAPDGTPTNALVGFFNMFARVRHDQRPDEIYAAFDMKEPTFRHRLYPEYKATRRPTPEEFKIQVPLLHEMLPLLGVHIMERPSVEADDLIGSAAVQFASRGDEVLILTSDKDIMQVLRPGVKILRPGKGVSSFEEYDVPHFTEKYGFPPDTMVDYLSLMGDSIDNIPGVPGVGEKTASKLLQSYGSIEGIMEHAGELKPALQKKIEEHGAQAVANRKLTRLKCDEDLSEFTSKEAAADLEAFGAFCARLGMKKAAESLGVTASQKERPAADPPAEAARPSPVSTGDDFGEAVPSAAAIPLDTILCAPRIALDLEESGAPVPYTIKEETLQSRRVILAAPDGSWWQGTLAELAPRLDELLDNRVVCLDAKALCYLMERPRLGGLWDVKTAWYLLHPDLESYDISKEIGLELSPGRALRLLAIARSMEEKIAAQNMTRVMNEIDLPLIPSLIGMERRGIRLDREKMLALSRELERQLNAITEKVYEAAGCEINLNSPKQIGELLFEKLGLPVVKKTKTGYSTDVSVLEQLREICGARCEIPGQLLEYRELQKMASGFVQPLLSAAGGDGLIHSTFESLTTGTGRLSSRDPNMQNLPTYSGWGQRIRECLIPSQPGHCFAAADYSQIELRVLAHLSGDPQLIEIFNSDRDIHTETAAMIFGLPADAVTKELRRSAKTVSFGLIYGMSVFGLASRLGTDRNTAFQIMDAYFAALPGVREYMETSKKKSLEFGYTSTLFGRRRPMDEIATGNQTKDHQKRVAINAPIQGTAADITKIAMNKVAAHFAGRDVAMVLQVHDSIVCECPHDQAEQTALELSQVMESAVHLSVPLKTERTVGTSLATV
ncbi:DNA polymerase [Pyramidobacter piscolens]|nr:DNA polymerase [Pyramidobacter piscolens]